MLNNLNEISDQPEPKVEGEVVAAEAVEQFRLAAVAQCPVDESVIDGLPPTYFGAHPIRWVFESAPVSGVRSFIGVTASASVISTLPVRISAMRAITGEAARLVVDVTEASAGAVVALGNPGPRSRRASAARLAGFEDDV